MHSTSGTCPRFARGFLACLMSAAAATSARADNVIGQVVNASGAGLVGITIKFSNGLPNAVTGINGLFAVTVPAGRYDIAFEPSSTYAPRLFAGVTVAGTADLGVVQLSLGFPVSGRAVDAQGQPVANCNINAYDQATGVKFYTPADSTDLLGNFSVVVPIGTCRVRVLPPTGLVVVAAERRNVVIVAPVPLGDVVLRNGFVVTGTVVNAATQQPIVDVDIDVSEALNGEDVVTPNDNTNAAGVFSVIVPFGLLNFAFDPPAGNALLGREMLNVYVPGSRNLGVLPLAQGAIVRGRVLGPGNVPLVNVDLDAEVPPGRYDVYLSHDKTDSNGNFEIVVPNGSYFFVVEPQAAAGVIGARTAATAIAGATTLPDFVLPAGVRVSGVVRGPDGSPEEGVNLDFVDPTTGLELVTPGDRTDAAGSYSAVVLNGSWNVTLASKRGSFARSETVNGVAVSGNTTFDRQLARVPAWVLTQGYGVMTVGQGGTVPLLLGIGNPNATSTTTRASLWLVDPAGGRLPLLANLDISLPPGLTATSLTFLPVPPVNPIHLGKPFEFEVRLDDLVTGIEHDRDHITFIVQ